MDDSSPKFRFIRKIIAVPFEKLVKVGNVADLLSSFDVYRFSLRNRDAGEGFNLARKVFRGGTEIREANLNGVNSRKGCKGANRRKPARKVWLVSF